MSGPFGAGALQFFGAADFYSHTINQSLRFGDGDGGYLSKTFGTPTNAVKWTLSVWVKSCGTGVRFLDAGGSAGNEDLIGIGTTGYEQVYFNKRTSSSYDYRVQTTQLLRDPSAWYHCVTVFDRDNSTSSDRQIIYINGERVTALDYSSYPSSSAVSRINTAVEHRIGATVYSTSYDNDGYIAEMTFVDGQALAPTSFGETKAGIWIPKNTSGLTFGNNGFRLQFQDSSSLGDDTSGNGNDFSVTNLASTDQVLDSPTNNFCTNNPLASLGTSSEGSLKAVTQVSGYGSQVATMGHTSGKWYWEVIPVSNVSGAPFIGVVDDTYNSLNSGSAVGYRLSKGVDSIGYYTSGALLVNTTEGDNSYGAAYAGDDIIGVALNLDDNQITFYKNNSSQGAFSYTFSGNHILPAVSDGTNAAAQTFAFNFGQDSSFAGTKTAQGNTDGNGVGDFYYTPPSGFLALCTANFADPAINPAEDEEPEDHFNTVLYSGNNTQLSVTGVGFQPDWVWIKKRNGASSHALQDSVRGSFRYLVSNSTAAENTDSGNDWFRSFDSDGFTVSKTTTGGTETTEWNNSGDTYVSWNWLAGGSASSNSNGSITSSVSANTKAGFSIVSYTGNATAGATVGHGLSSTPDLYIVKSRTLTTSWVTYHKNAAASPQNGYLVLNDDDDFFDTLVWNDTAPTSSVFSLGGTGYSSNNSGATYIAYCFHGVEGYSKFGSYISTNDTNGHYVYTGFRPAWVMVKAASTGGSNYNWTIYDNQRSPINPISLQLEADQNADDESTRGVPIDFLSNGFKLRNSYSEANGGSLVTYIYLAFAEQPFKFSNAR